MDQTLTIAVIIWVGCAIACGFLAPSKVRPASAWFLGGLLFGIFALAALAIVEPLEPIPADQVRTCVNCGKAVNPDRKQRCQNCGELFATPKA